MDSNLNLFILAKVLRDLSDAMHVIQQFHAIVGTSQNFRCRGAVDDLIHCCAVQQAILMPIIMFANIYLLSFMKF